MGRAYRWNENKYIPNRSKRPYPTDAKASLNMSITPRQVSHKPGKTSQSIKRQYNGDSSQTKQAKKSSLEIPSNSTQFSRHRNNSYSHAQGNLTASTSTTDLVSAHTQKDLSPSMNLSLKNQSNRSIFDSSFLAQILAQTCTLSPQVDIQIPTS